MRTLPLLALALLASSCHWVFPHEPGSDRGTDDREAPCEPPACWDVSGVFTASIHERQPEQLQIFGVTVTDGQRVAAPLVAGVSDATYTESGGGCNAGWPDVVRADAWDIERTSLPDGRFRLRVRGRSKQDCQPGFQPECSGELAVNLARGWKIGPGGSCFAAADNLSSNQVLITTHCTIDAATGTISWRAGSLCATCCACPDGAGVDIDVTVER